MLYAFGMSPVGITILHDIFNDWKYVNGGFISFQYHYNYGQCISFDVSKLDPEHLGTFPANYENDYCVYNAINEFPKAKNIPSIFLFAF